MNRFSSTNIIALSVSNNVVHLSVRFLIFYSWIIRYFLDREKQNNYRYKFDDKDEDVEKYMQIGTEKFMQWLLAQDSFPEFVFFILE